MVYSDIKKIICDRLSVSKSKIDNDTTFASLGADSLDVVDIAMTIEEKYGLDVDNTDLSEIETVGDLVELIEKETKN